jgi:hypothetical protein
MVVMNCGGVHSLQLNRLLIMHGKLFRVSFLVKNVGNLVWILVNNVLINNSFTSAERKQFFSEEIARCKITKN